MTKDLTGRTIAGRFVLAELRHSSGDLASYHTADGAVIDLVPSDSIDAAEAANLWPATARLSHPNLVPVLASGVDDVDGVRLLYRVTPRPEESVADVLPDRALSADEVRQVLEAIVPALAYLHENGFAHRSIRPESIVAMDNSVKLSIDTVRAGGVDAAAADIPDLGRTVVQMMTRTRPEGRGAEAATHLPVPFGPIAGGTMAHGWTLEMVRRALAGQSVAFPSSHAAAPEPDRTSAALKLPPKWLMIGAAALVLVLLVFALSRPSKQAPAPVPVAEQPRPNPVAARNPAAPAPAPAATAARTRTAGYAVVAATYRQQAAAEKRAASIRRSWTRSQVTVHPSGRHYVVALGTGLTRQEAERLQKQARAAGLPRDTHVTRF